jgi:hypothetical protein
MPITKKPKNRALLQSCPPRLRGSPLHKQPDTIPSSPILQAWGVCLGWIGLNIGMARQRTKCRSCSGVKGAGRRHSNEATPLLSQATAPPSTMQDMLRLGEQVGAAAVARGQSTILLE